MANQEFEKGFSLFIVTCVAVTVIWLFMKCVSSIWSSLFSGPQEYYVPTQTYFNERSFVNEGMRSYLSVRDAQNQIIRRTKRVVAIDTECVGAGFKGSQSMLARVSLVNRNGQVYDRFVKPTMPVTDFRTFVSGIRRADLVDAEDYHVVRQVVAHLLKDCILVGHDVKNDLDSLDLIHLAADIRDTSTYETFRTIYLLNNDIFKNVMLRKWNNMGHYDAEEMAFCTMSAYRQAEKCFPKNGKLSLKWLAKHFLKRDIQAGEHSSVEDARAALDLYLLYEKEWEGGLAK